MAITIAGEVQYLSRRHSKRTRQKISQGLKRYWRLLPEDERKARGAFVSMALEGRPLIDKLRHWQRISASKKLYWERRRSQVSQQ